MDEEHLPLHLDRNDRVADVELDWNVHVVDDDVYLAPRPEDTKSWAPLEHDSSVAMGLYFLVGEYVKHLPAVASGSLAGTLSRTSLGHTR